MHGLYIHHLSEEDDSPHLQLLSRRQGLEIMRQTIMKGATVWLLSLIHI